MKEKKNNNNNINNLNSEIDKNIKFYVNRKLSRNINLPLPIKNFPSIDNNNENNNKKHNKIHSSVLSSKDELSTTHRTSNNFYTKPNLNNNNNNNSINKHKRLTIFNNLNTNFNNNNNNNIFDYQNKNPTKISNSIPRNSISVLDRNKIKSIPLQHLAIDINNNTKSPSTFKNEKNIFKLKPSKSLSKNNFSSFSSNNNIDNDYLNLKAKNFNSTNDYFTLKSFNNNNKSHSTSSKKRKKNKYSLKTLMNMNPYSRASKEVFYNNILLENHLTDINNNHINSQNFFENFSNQKKIKFKYKKTRVLSSITLRFSENNFKKSLLIWRLLNETYKLNLNYKFKAAIRNEGLKLLWKNHSIIMENILINYNNFKWFLEKGKYISQDALKEFLYLIKFEKNSIITFCNKTFLIFDDKGNNLINVKKFLFFMQLTSRISNNYEKINFIVDLFEDYFKIKENKSINVLDAIDIFKVIINIDNFRFIKTLKNEIKKKLLNGKFSENYNENFVEKNKFKNFLLENKIIKGILRQYQKDYSNSNKIFDEELLSVFNSVIRNYKRLMNLNDIIEYNNIDINKMEKILKIINEKNIKKNNIENLFEDLELKDD